MAAFVQLDTALIRRRRAELGISVRAAAESIGLSGPTFTRLESGIDHGGLELVVVVRLASLLGVSLDQLIVQGGRDVASSGETAGDATDVAALGAVLFATQTHTPVGTLCEVHGWTLARLHEAEVALDAALCHVGITLSRQNARLGLARAEGAVDRDVLERSLRKHQGRDHVSITEARLLHHVEHGDAPTQPSNAERVALGMLVNAGLITFGSSRPRGEAPLILSEDVRFSLLIDEEPSPHAAPRRPRRSPACDPDVPPPTPTNAPRKSREKRQP
jgi:transcriptional regulator with XRE-family HTH domain